MQKLFVFVKLISVLVFVSSCAYERDSGLRPDPKPKPQVNDVLKDKANHEILDYKYQSLALSCEIVSEVAAQDEAESSMSLAAEEAETTPPAAEPVVNEGAKTKFDLVAQMSVDSKLEKEQTNAKMEVVEDARKLTLKLKIKPVLFIQSLNLKVPTVCSTIAISGMKIKNNINAVVLDYDEKYVENFVNIYNNIELLKKISDYGYKTFKKYYSLEKNEEYFKKILF
jgi:hypothetical protein